MKKRFALTRVELLVLLGSGIIILGLLIPAVSTDHHGTHRRNQCSTQLKNFALAAIQYENTKGQLPGYLEDFGTFTGSTDPVYPDVAPESLHPHRKIGTVFVALLPWLDAQPTYERWTEDRYPVVHYGDGSWLSTPSGFVAEAAPNLAILQCPSDPLNDEDYGRNSYISNNGMHHRSKDGADQWTLRRSDGSEVTIDFARSMSIANGVFNNKFAGLDADGKPVAIGPAVRLDDFKDGMSNTILFSESLQAGPWHQAGFATADDLRVEVPESEVRYPPEARFTQGMVWHYEDDEKIDGASALLPIHRIDGGDPFTTTMNRQNAGDLARPSSAHVDGVNASMADGGTRFISNSIDYRVYQALLTPRGIKSDVPKQDYVLDGEDM
ncbi:hypothetical protein Q31b_08690 [Novipirellula aureliae]|uniref:DUF1559 domain-containing protein n=1 Tax=Novipirellula aureliae TaxID=2527966 RepID=A0A5C6E7R7_9BACT|nr:DUF1559 domain-containing protein [Novipirellula aureliae]TWU45693.1 hypothetical protein Q31b_08690 [Novipirellula aureliae]